MTNAALRRYDDVTPVWLRNALNKTWPDAEVVSVRIGPVFGNKKNKFRVEVEYSHPACGLPPSYIVKGNFPDEHNPATGTFWAMSSELQSIRDIMPLVKAPVMPKYHEILIESDAASIVMEDLRLSGAKFFDAFQTLHFGEAMAFMDAFARMHASAWDSKEFVEGGTMSPNSLAGENRKMINEIYFPDLLSASSWRSYITVPRGRAVPLEFQELSRVANAWSRMWSMLKQTATVLIHGDEHPGNLFVTRDGRAGVLDPFARVEHWPIGISDFLLCGLDAMDRRRWERALLAHYCTRLSHYGVSHVPAFDDMWLFYRCSCLYPLIVWINNNPVWQPEDVATAYVARIATAVIDHGTFDLLGV